MKLHKRLIAGFTAMTLAISSCAIYLPVYASEATNVGTEIPKQENSSNEKNEPQNEEKKLEVSIPNNWTKDTVSWLIESESDAKIYFMTNDTNLSQEEWGTYTDATQWDNGGSIPEGIRYIKFWAVRKDKKTNKEIVAVSEAKTYMLDTSKPEDFELEYVIEGNKTYIRNKTKIRDTYSNNLVLYYNIHNHNTTLYNSVRDIKNNCKPLTTVNDENDFSIECDAKYDVRTDITVYVIDEVGNFKSQSFEIPDTSKADITSIGINSDKWEKDLSWTIYTNPEKDVDVYYETAKDSKDDWGTYNDKKKWTDTSINEISEEHHYIHFWAVNNVENRAHQIGEVTKSYKYDHTSPYEFDLKVSEPYANGNYMFGYKKYIDIENVAPIKDDNSGIAKITYRIENGDEKTISPIVNGDGSVDFKLTLENNSTLNKIVHFKIYDNAGNFTSKDIILNDTVEPKIEELQIVSGDNKNHAISSYSYGYKNDNYTRKIYCTEKDYLKLKVKEVNLAKITVIINNAHQEFSFVDDIDAKNSNIEISTENIEEAYFYIPLSSLKNLNSNAENTIRVAVFDYSSLSDTANLKDNDDVCNIFYDNQSANISIDRKPKEINNKYYYGKNFSDSLGIKIVDNMGLKNYTIKLYGPDNKLLPIWMNETKYETIKDVDLSIGKAMELQKQTVDEEGKEHIEKIPYYDENKEFSAVININNEYYKDNGNYKLIVTATDLAGNSISESYDFIVDSKSPEIVGNSYTCQNSILKYLTFGIFGKTKINLQIETKEDATGAGIDDSKVYFICNDIKINAKKVVNNKYLFEDIPVGMDGIPHIVIYDNLENYSKYYFKTSDGKLGTDSNLNTHLILETKKPEAKIVLQDNDKYTIDGEIWYPSDVTYSVIANDSNSGLNTVKVDEYSIDNDFSETKVLERIETGIDVDGKHNAFTKMQDRFLGTATYKYYIKNEGNFKISVDAIDNAGNSISENDAEVSVTEIIHIDKTNPEIVRFEIGNDSDEGAEFEQGTYGYYFKDDTTVKVYVKDSGNSAGIDYVVLYTKDVEGKQKSVKVDSLNSKFIVDESGNTYAEFVIEKGFKGQICALVADKVAKDNPSKDNYAHTSGLRYANGAIVEDESIHGNSSSIIIIESELTDNKDAKGLPLYRTNIPLRVNAQDTFSGIAAVEWSVENDNISGIIQINNDGSIQSNSEYVVLNDDSIKRESNLVTYLEFGLSVTSNSNDNTVTIKLIDRAGNESIESKQYSIDTTAPTITASLSNQNPTNETYYNTNQIVTISITERNFNPENVVFEINNVAVNITNWTATGDEDNTIYVGSYEISEDGDYYYSIKFTDMAGNDAVSFSQDKFTVDKTEPVINTNFGEFSNGESNYFGSDSMNKTAHITIIEHNFTPEQANVEILKKSSGSSHDSDAMESVRSFVWSANGDEHSLDISFNEGDDGVYQIRISPIDLANNPAETVVSPIFEIDYTKPVISSRNGNSIYASDSEYSYLEVYNEKTGIIENFKPSIGFSDINFDHLEYEVTMYTPEYSKGENNTKTKELEKIIPVTNQGTISENIYTLPEFSKDGVYSVNIVAVDKAGNRSIICKNTSVLMMESDVLAYITDSSKMNSTGWYSIQKDENTPVSKRPDSFSDLYITVFAQNDSDTRIVLRDDNGNSTNIDLLPESNEDMYAVGVYNYKLPKEYFAENYAEGTNKDLYLWVENTVNNETSHVTLGWIRIDAVEPTCDLPKGLKNWKSYITSKKEIVLTNISESLDPSKCIVYDNGKAITQTDFTYSEENKTLTYTLDKGWHDLSFVLVDEAGNTHTVQEISSIQVGILYCLWFRIICGVGVIVAITGLVIFIKKKKKSYANS